jgi:opacity protein-like surface antigen
MNDIYMIKLKRPTMKKTIFTALLVAGLGCAPAYAAGPYVSASVGAGIAGDIKPSRVIDYDYDILDAGVAFNGAIGYDFSPCRTEISIGYQHHDFSGYSYGGVLSDISGHSVSLITIMANGYYDFNSGSGIHPYVMGGIGIAVPDATDKWVDKTAFAWQAGAGVGIKVSEKATVDLGYRYLRPQGLKDNFDVDVNLETHNIMAGIRFEL